MLIAKLRVKQKALIAEVLRVDRVAFDVRPGWVLLALPIGRKCKKELFWHHPDDTKFEWITEFNFNGE